MRRSVVLLIVVALVAATSVTTWVVAGAAMKGKISGCVDDRTGEIDQMRFGKTPKGDECDEGETAFTWNVKGRRGAPGDPGAAGPAGPRGATGATGPQGPPGLLSAADVYVKSGTVGPWSGYGGGTHYCDTGDLAIGGFFEILADPAHLGDLVVIKAGNSDTAAFQVGVENPLGRTFSLTINVMCVDTNP